MTRKITIVDKNGSPLGGVSVKQIGRGSATGSDGVAYIHSDYGKVTISHENKSTQIMPYASVPDVVMTSIPGKEKIPSYIIPAIGGALLLIALMSFGSEPKEVTL